MTFVNNIMFSGANQDLLIQRLFFCSSSAKEICLQHAVLITLNGCQGQKLIVFTVCSLKTPDY